MKRQHLLSAFFLIGLAASIAWTQPFKEPRLVVVVSIDQFPFEYLVRFGGAFGTGGFRRLMTDGANFTNASYKHAMNTTGPGHAVILSGTYGNQNGIIGNSWYDRATHASVYCVEDKHAAIVGGQGAGRSPANFVGSTFGDELRIVSGFRAKVVSVSYKDRAAILLGGYLADAAYWMADSCFVTSTFYTDSLPTWAQRFNVSGLVNSYFGRNWEQRAQASALVGTDIDDATYEESGNGLGRVFPHPITGRNRDRITSSYYSALQASPFGNDVVLAFAKAAVNGEQLGQRGVTDLLCISFSANDVVGHAFGPYSREVAEMTLATDSVIAGLLTFLDASVGAGNYLAVLTSDHGVAPVPEYILAHRKGAEAGRIATDSIVARCERALLFAFGPPPAGSTWIENESDRNITLRTSALAARRVDRNAAARIVAEAAARAPGVAAAFTQDDLQRGGASSLLEEKVKRSFYPGRSGDVFYVLKPYYIDAGGSTGTTHGEPYDYSAHVPLLLYGSAIAPGTYYSEASPADIAPTLSAVTGVEFPAGREGRVLVEALKQISAAPAKSVPGH
jgi:predicted AlkP superfamily pyrophosphatase or phosphodiesterase